MDKDFSKLKPAAIWRHFERIMSIPHPSKHEAALATYIKEFAASKGIECIEDEAGNILLRKGATKGMESRKGVILQGHMDMVPQNNIDKEFDFLTDPIEGYIDGGWVRANGTTLGADNGIGVAAALAIFEEEDLRHGKMEALFTVDEEEGLEGALSLKEGVLQGDILLNLDSEDEGELCIGCAGGLTLVATFDHESVPTPQGDYTARRLVIGGLSGGHSGVQIHEQRGNAIKLLFRLLRLTKLDILIAAIDGGTRHNAIPRDAYVDLLIHNDDLTLFEEQVERYQATLTEEYQEVDPAVEVSTTEVTYPETMIDEEVASCIVWAVAGCPNGVTKMSYSIAGLVDSSLNVATIKSDENQTTVEISIRTSTENEKVALADSVASIFELADAEVACGGGYPGWKPNVESPILSLMKQSYQDLFGAEAKVVAVHAGLECGVIGATYPNLDMISFGPTILSPHSPAECVEIESVEKFYTLLCHTIENAPEKE